MSTGLANDFFNYYKKEYSIKNYTNDESLTEEDSLLLLCAFDKMINKENSNGELGLEAIKSLECYDDYFKTSKQHTKILEQFLDKIAQTDNLKIALERLLNKYLEDKDLVCKSGISYSDEKQTLRSDGDIYDESVIISLSQRSGLDKKEIKNKLAKGLEQYIQKKEEYVNNALYHMHSIYSCVDLEK